MKIKDIALSAAAIGERVVKAIAIGAVEVWSAIKYIKFADPVVEQICAENFGDGNGLTEEQAAAVTDIGTIFQGNTNITSFDEFSKFVSIKKTTKGAFSSCKSLKSITLPQSLTEIGNRMFNGCSSLDEIIIPNGVKSLLVKSFYECFSLKSVLLPDSIATIDNECFRYDSSLEISELYLPNLKYIGNQAFAGCSIKKITNLGNLQSVSSFNGSFGNKLEEVIFPDTCVNLGNTGGYGTFEDNNNLTHVRLSPNIVMVGSRFFNNCTSLRKVDNLESVQKLISSAFNGCPLDDHEELNLSNLTQLGEHVFKGSKIKRITSLGSTTTIGELSGLTELEYVNLHEGLTQIGSFYNSPKLGPELVLPSTVTSIGQNALNACPSLKTIICNAITPPELSPYGSFDTRIEAYYVPDGSVSSYRKASGWIKFADKILPMEAYLYGYIKFADPAVEAICVANWDTNGTGFLNKEEAKAVTSLGTVFKENTEIVSFNELADFVSVKSIPSSAFFGCTSLAEVSMPDGVTSIEGMAFQNCTSLVKANIPSSVTTLSFNCFYGCPVEIDDLSVPLLNSIGGNAFSDKAKIRKISNLGSISKLGIGQNALGLELEEVVLPATCIEIGGSQFRGCTKLHNINLDGVTKFGDYAFLGCKSLSIDLNLPNIVKFGGNSVFDNADIRSLYAPNLEIAEQGTFNGCSNFSGELNFPNLKGEIGRIWMSGTAITKILNLGEVTAILGGVATGAFSDCKSLTYVNLPSTLTSIGEYGFQGCRSLQVFICNATTPPTCAAASVFLNCNNTFVIYVPDASVDAYKAKEVWSTYADRIKPLSQYVEA